MGKNHLKRLAAPKTWEIGRKTTKFTTKSRPGPHSLMTGMPLSTVLKEILGYASTSMETKKILNTNEIKIDGKTRKDFRFSVGVFDIIAFTNTDQHFRVVLNKKGKLSFVRIKQEETLAKPCKIMGKTALNGKIQLNLYDGSNILVDNNTYKVGDTLMLALPDKKISRHLKLDKKAAIFLTGGKHIGETGNVEDIVGNKIIYKDQKGNLIETSKRYAFVVGDAKPLITLE